MSTLTRGDCCQLYTRPKPLAFKAAEAAELAVHLAKLERQTTLLPVGGVRELQLSPRGTTLEGDYRYTASCFAWLTTRLCGGAGRFFHDLSGMRQSSDEGVDGPMAVRIFNSLLDLRFDRFSELRIIRNDHSRTIDGLISGTHRFLGNPQFHAEVVAFLRDNRSDLQFSGGLLLGRQLLLWFREPASCLSPFVSDKPWPCYGGCYFCNGEATGASVRGTASLFTPVGVCLASFASHGLRVKHSGNRFDRKFLQILERATTTPLPRAAIEEGIPRLLGQPLLPNPHDPTALEGQLKRITGALVPLGVTQRFARDIAERAVYAGAGEGPLSPLPSVLASRTLLDLLAPLLRAARALDLNRRERLELAAFEILRGHIGLLELPRS